jgi:hypothetical protein
MQLIYEGKDITDAIEIRKADVTDNAGGELDSLELQSNDPKGYWSQWNPEENHTIQIKESGFDTGTMYADEISQRRGLIIIKALPVKQETKTENTKAWDNVRFLTIARELANKNRLTLQTFGVQNQLYSRVDQFELSDLSFLDWLCQLEGNALKITGQKLVIFNEQYMESQVPDKTITPDLIDGDFCFKNKSAQIYGVCKLKSGDIQYEFRDPDTFGPTLKVNNLTINSLAEAERFCKGLLRSKNKFEQTFSGSVKLDPGIAAGITLKLEDFGLADGNYFAYQIVHKLVEKRTVLRLRKPLEGY